MNSPSIGLRGLLHGAALFRNLTLVGAALFAVGLALEPRYAWGGYLMGFNYLVGLSLAGPLFLALLHLADARWASSLREVPRAMARSLPVAFVLGILLLFGVHSLYEWSHAAVVSEDPLLRQKAGYLNPVAFALRMVAFFVLWWWTSRLLQEDREPPSPAGRRARALRRSALFMATFAVTYSLASVDWIQSLEPHWFSTIFALRTATGLVLSGLAAATLLVIARGAGPGGPPVTSGQLHDLGRLTLSFSVLWVYIWYCEYMLIWYTNIPEETAYYVLRQTPAWSTLQLANLGINWLIPFAILLIRSARGNPKVLWRLAMLLLLGRAFDLYVLIGPSVYGDAPRIGLSESGALLGMVSLFFLRARAGSRPTPDDGPAPGLC